MQNPSKLIFIPRLYHQIKLEILRKSNMQNKATIFQIFRLFEIYVGVSLWCCSMANAHRVLLIAFFNILFHVLFLLPYYLWSWCRIQGVSLSCFLKWKLPLSKTRPLFPWIKAIRARAERTVKEYITFLTFTKDQDDLKAQVKLLTVKLLSFILCCRSLKLDLSTKLVRCTPNELIKLRNMLPFTAYGAHGFRQQCWVAT